MSTGFSFFFFVSYAYFVLYCLTFVFPTFIHAESVHEFALLARVIISCCILMSELLFGLCFRCCQINVFCGSRAEVVLRPIFVT